MNKSQPLFSLLLRLWTHISRRRRLQLTALGGLMLLGTISELVSLGMVLPFLGALTEPDRIFDHPWARPMVVGLGLARPQQLLLPITIIFCLAATFAGATRFALLWGQTRLGSAIGVDLSSEAYRRTLYQPYAMHVVRNSSEVVATLMNKISIIIYFIIVPLLTLITSLFIVLTIVVFMIFVDPEITLVTFFGVAFLYALMAFATKRRLTQDSQHVTAGQNHVAQVIQEGLGGIRDVLIDGLQETYFRIYRRADNRYRRAAANIYIVGVGPRPIFEAFCLVLIGALAYAVSNRPGGVAAAIPLLGALALAAQRMLPLVQQGYHAWASMLGGQAPLGDVLDLLEQPMPSYSTLLPPPPIPFRQQITLKGLQFRYSPQGPSVLRRIDLRIPRGSRVGFLGTTGSGKSTLLDIVMGLLTPTSGTLFIDDAVIDESNHRAWQTHIAHVPQAIFLADTTVAENIAFGVPSDQIEYDRVRRAAQRAQIADTIESWPKDYDTFVGEQGIRLSGGQRQRIGIARALYKEADVLVFDEATSALDTETESEVMEAIENLDPDLTVLIVAHRVTTLRNCTQVVELTNGQITRIGSYEALVMASEARGELKRSEHAIGVGDGVSVSTRFKIGPAGGSI